MDENTNRIVRQRTAELEDEQLKEIMENLLNESEYHGVDFFAFAYAFIDILFKEAFEIFPEPRDEMEVHRYISRRLNEMFPPPSKENPQAEAGS